MRYLVQIDGREEPLCVDIQSDKDGKVHALVDGQSIEFGMDCLPTGQHLVTTDSDKRVVDLITSTSGYELVDENVVVTLSVGDERDAWLGTGAGDGASGRVTVAMPGRVIAVLVEEGQDVQKGERLVVIEAMKMENDVNAPCDGLVTSINVEVGGQVEAGQTLVTLE